MMGGMGMENDFLFKVVIVNWLWITILNNISGSVCLQFVYDRWFIVACKDGTVGHGCINNCSGECADDSPCNKQTGHCNRGCKPGYTNVFCNQSTLSFFMIYLNFVEINEQRVSNFAGWCSMFLKHRWILSL